jgi:LacI family transcriptional regulator
MNIPVVLLSTASSQYSFPYVKVDDKQAAYDATNYLIKKGHKNIAMISGDEKDPIAGKPRIEGYREALRDFGIPFQENLLVFGDFGYRSGYAAMEKLLRSKAEFTAVFASSDEMAAGVLSAAYQHGIKVPEQLSVIGYDNLQISEMSIPPLTTVAQPLFEMGKLAAEMLLKMIQTKTKVPSQILRHEIVERQSVARV